MMDELDLLRRYGARPAPPPHVDVAADVLATLRRHPHAARSASPLRPLLTVAAASWVFAFSVAFFASQAWAQVQDPLSALLSPFVVSLQ
jgi:hypothetical protein